MSKMLFNELLIKKDGLIKGPFGGDIKKSLFVPRSDDAYKVYEQGVVLKNDINHGNYYISKDHFENKLKRFEVQKGDLLMTGAGTLGEILTVPANAPKGVINQALLRIRLDQTVISGSFFKYYFKYYIKAIISRINGDSVIPNLPPLSIIKDTEVNIPNLTDQKYITNVLSSLDSKIELNNRINAELEAMAKTLYDYWFVQFDFPDAKGKPYKSSGGKMVWNVELKRAIPEGWNMKKLGKAIKIIRGASPRPIDDYLSDKGKSWVKISDATKTDNRFIIKTKQFIIEEGVPKSRSVFPNTLILSNSASPAIPRIMKIQACVHDGWLIVDEYSEGLTPEFMYHFFEYERPRILTMGSGSIFKNLKTDYLKDFKFINPPKSILDLITPQLKTISESIYNRTLENQKLTELRDWLLPMLMNGQVRVN